MSIKPLFVIAIPSPVSVGVGKRAFAVAAKNAF
ncbi:hypothetical protein JDF658_25540, partial [Carboxydocella sp. JDF658]